MKPNPFLRLVGAALGVTAVTGCAALVPPSDAELSTLPVVVYPAKPTPGVDAVYELPAGVPIELRVIAEGSALKATGAASVSAELAHSLYLYKTWASVDDKHWHRASDLIRAQITARLPSYQTPGPGEIGIMIDDKPR